MKISFACLVICVLVSCCGGNSMQEFVSKDKFAEKKCEDSLLVRNDVWGSTAGEQTISVQSGQKWCVDCSHGPSGGIKSYPHSSLMVGKPMSAIHSAVSTYDGYVEVHPGPLAYSMTYDIWLQKKKYELMIWVNLCGAVGPLGEMKQSNLAVGGFTWKVYKGTNGVNQVFSFVNLHPGFKGSVNLKEIIDWLCTENWITEHSAVILDEVQFGYEITSTPAHTKLCITGFTCKIN